LSRGPLIRGRLLRLDADEHILLVTQHHIVSDGWSVAVLIGEFNALYAAFSQGQEDPLPPLALQYADYAAWQQQWLQGEALQAQTRFWREALKDAPALLELPSDRPRPQVQSYVGASLPLRLTPKLSKALRQFSQSRGLTPFMTLLGAWSVLLARLSNQPQVVIGTPVANRPRSETEALIGFFVNTLALRVDLGDQPSVGQLLARIKAITLDAYGHQDLPFEQVVEALQPERSLGHSPLFQAMLVLGNTPRDRALALPGLRLSPLERATRTTQFDLSLALNDDGEVIAGHFEYATDLFDESTIAHWGRHFLRLLEAMLADAEQPVSALPLLDSGQRRQLLVDFNRTQAEVPDLLLHQGFEQHARTRPNASAVLAEGLSLSYAQLNRRANRIAHRLLAAGVRPDDPVALLVNRSPEMLIGILAILKAGGAYVPLDPDYPRERLLHMLADSAPRLLLSQGSLPDLLPGLSVPVLLLDGTLNEADTPHDRAQDENPDPIALGLTSRHLAYVLYTSGSTGLPKGVMIEHRSVCNQIGALQERYGLNAQDRILQFAAITFDMAVEEIFGALLSGAALVLRSDAWLDTTAFCALCEQHEITVANLPTVFWQQLSRDAQAEIPPVLRQIMIGGEAVGKQAVAQWFARTGHRPVLFNAYGPTEATVNASIRQLEPGKTDFRSIGKPVRNMQLHVLDSHGQLVPLGVAGEIHIGGMGVARGYLNRPELNAERFITDPFSDEPRARLYKTGDLGRWLPDGNLEYLGRNDDQVKIRGFRIELGEIEALLAACPGVREVVVIAREDDEASGKRLVAYLCGEPAPAEQLRAELLKRLPEYMVPSAFVQLDALPLTPNGKLDRRALPAPSLDAFASRAYEAPQGEVELTLAGIWQDLLGLEQVGRHDRFFELGGHSLLAVSLIERLRQHGLNADVRAVFTAPSLREMALALGRETRELFQAPANLIAPGCQALSPDLLPLVELSQAEIDRIVAAVPGGAANIQDIYPLAPLQQGILFHHLLKHEGDAYLVRSLIEFDDRARLDAFVAALQSVIDRHDILRTAVHWAGLPQAVQVVQRQVRLPLHEVTLDAGEDALVQLQRLSDPRQLRLDLSQAPLLRAYSDRDPHSERWLLALLDHHMVSDHVTLELILEEIQAILHGQGDHLPAPLPYQDFVAQTLATSPQVHEAY
ncbi:MAG TPA: amino acid adenylation domain-containing protein, partial [Pseudomonas sp.]|nr:amino acid adenylation domain-containing protein [Pseudomonas sp.]